MGMDGGEQLVEPQKKNKKKFNTSISNWCTQR